MHTNARACKRKQTQDQSNQTQTKQTNAQIRAWHMQASTKHIRGQTQPTNKHKQTQTHFACHSHRFWASGLRDGAAHMHDEHTDKHAQTQTQTKQAHACMAKTHKNKHGMHVLNTNKHKHMNTHVWNAPIVDACMHDKRTNKHTAQCTVARCCLAGPRLILRPKAAGPLLLGQGGGAQTNSNKHA